MSLEVLLYLTQFNKAFARALPSSVPTRLAISTKSTRSTLELLANSLDPLLALAMVLYC